MIRSPSHDLPAAERVFLPSPPLQSLPAAPVVLEPTQRTLDASRIEEMMPRVGYLMADAQASMTPLTESRSIRWQLPPPYPYPLTSFADERVRSALPYNSTGQLTRSLSMPVMPTVVQAPSPIQYVYQMPTMAPSYQMVPAPPTSVQMATVPLTTCNSRASPWLPPPLPPAPSEVTDRLERLERRSRSNSPPRAESPQRVVRKRFDEERADVELSKQLREELWQAQEAERRTREDMMHRHQDVAAENYRLKEDNERLVANVASEQRALVKLQHAHADLLNSNKSLQQQVEEGADSLKLRDDIARLHADYDKIKRMFDFEAQARQEAEGRERTSQMEINRLQALLAQEQGKLQEQNADYQRLQSMLLESENQRRRESENAVMRSSSERNYEEQISMLNGDNSALREKIEQLEGDKVHLKTSLDNLRESNREMLDAKRGLQDANRQLQIQVDSQQYANGNSPAAAEVWDNSDQAFGTMSHATSELWDGLQNRSVANPSSMSVDPSRMVNLTDGEFVRQSVSSIGSGAIEVDITMDDDF